MSVRGCAKRNLWPRSPVGRPARGRRNITMRGRKKKHETQVQSPMDDEWNAKSGVNKAWNLPPNLKEEYIVRKLSSGRNATNEKEEPEENNSIERTTGNLQEPELKTPTGFASPGDIFENNNDSPSSDMVIPECFVGQVWSWGTPYGQP